MHAAIRRIEGLPTYERDLVRWMLAGLASTHKPLGWYSFASAGLNWIERLFVDHRLVDLKRDKYGTVYFISPTGREVHARLIETYGTLHAFPQRPM